MLLHGYKLWKDQVPSDCAAGLCRDSVETLFGKQMGKENKNRNESNKEWTENCKLKDTIYEQQKFCKTQNSSTVSL